MTRTVTPTATSTATLAPDLTPPQPLPAALGPAHRVEGRDKVTGHLRKREFGGDTDDRASSGAGVS